MDAEAAEAVALDPVVAPADPECIVWIKSKVHVNGDEELLWQMEHDEIISDFVGSATTRRLFAFIDEGLGGLTLQLGVPQPSNEQVPAAPREAAAALKKRISWSCGACVL